MDQIIEFVKVVGPLIGTGVGTLLLRELFTWIARWVAHREQGQTQERAKQEAVLMNDRQWLERFVDDTRTDNIKLRKQNEALLLENAKLRAMLMKAGVELT